MLAHLGHHLVTALLIPLLPYIRNDLSLTYTQAGWLVSANSLAYGISQLPAGWLADRIGPRIVLTIGVAGVGVAGLLIGLAPTYVMLVFFLVLLGIAGGGYHPSAAPLIAASVEAKSRGRALGLHQIGGSASFFLAPLIAAGIAAALGWRGTFLALCAPTIAFGIAFYILLGRSGHAKKVEQNTLARHAAIAPAPGRLRRLIVFVVLGTASMVLVYSTISFIPLFLVDHFEGISNEAAAAVLSLVYFGGLWAGPLGGYLSDRLGGVPVLLAGGLIAGPAIYLLNVASPGIALVVTLIMIGMAMNLGMPVVEAYIISHTSEHRRSTVLGIYYLGSRGGPAIAPAIGYLIDHYGFYSGFSIVGATMVAVTLVCAIFLWGSRD